MDFETSTQPHLFRKRYYFYVSSFLTFLQDIKAALVCLLKALKYLKLKNLLHRDIKPPNVMKVGDVWKLGDFGMVNQLSLLNGNVDTYGGTQFTIRLFFTNLFLIYSSADMRLQRYIPHISLFKTVFFPFTSFYPALPQRFSRLGYFCCWNNTYGDYVEG